MRNVSAFKIPPERNEDLLKIGMPLSISISKLRWILATTFKIGINIIKSYFLLPPHTRKSDTKYLIDGDFLTSLRLHLSLLVC